MEISRLNRTRTHARAWSLPYKTSTPRRHPPEANYRPDKFAKLGTQPLLAPVVIAICMARDITGEIAEIEDIGAVACSAQNLHISASAIGLGGF